MSTLEDVLAAKSGIAEESPDAGQPTSGQGSHHALVLVTAFNNVLRTEIVATIVVRPHGERAIVELVILNAHVLCRTLDPGAVSTNARSVMARNLDYNTCFEVVGGCGLDRVILDSDLAGLALLGDVKVLRVGVGVGLEFLELYVREVAAAAVLNEDGGGC